jgi:hypothetical protein
VRSASLFSRYKGQGLDNSSVCYRISAVCPLRTLTSVRLSCAARSIAQDIYFNMGEFGPHDELVRYVEWNTCAREALLTVVLLWLAAIGLAIYAYGRARKSLSATDGSRPRPLVIAALLLPVAGFVAAFILGLYLPRD